MRWLPVMAVLAVLGTAGLTGGCSSSPARTSPPTSSTTTTTVPATMPPSTSRPTSPPTSVYSPARPQPSPDAAALALIQAWAAGDRAAAAAVASPAAVATLLAVPYPAGFIQARGCTDPSVNPGTCTYANRQSGSLYQMQLDRTASGWYVASVTVES